MYAFLLEGVQNLWCRAGPWAIVKGQHQFLGLQGQRCRELLTAHPWRGLRIDLKHPLSPERGGIVGAGGTQGQRRSKGQCKCKKECAHHGRVFNAGRTTDRQAHREERIYPLVVARRL